MPKVFWFFSRPRHFVLGEGWSGRAATCGNTCTATVAPQPWCMPRELRRSLEAPACACRRCVFEIGCYQAKLGHLFFRHILQPRVRGNEPQKPANRLRWTWKKRRESSKCRASCNPLVAAHTLRAWRETLRKHTRALTHTPSSAPVQSQPPSFPKDATSRQVSHRTNSSPPFLKDKELKRVKRRIANRDRRRPAVCRVVEEKKRLPSVYRSHQHERAAPPPRRRARAGQRCARAPQNEPSHDTSREQMYRRCSRVATGDGDHDESAGGGGADPVVAWRQRR
jgi:hypothetical protein